jgi:FkbM family methyltransferase
MRAALDLPGALKHALLRLTPWVRTAWATHRATGLEYRVSPRDVVGRTIMRRQAYEPELTAWLLAAIDVGPPGIFLDVGANLGWFTLQVARLTRVERVVAFEPDVANHQLLQTNIERNGLASRVDAVACALGDGPGLARLNLYKGSNLGRHSLAVDHGRGGSWVPVEALDTLLARLGLAEAPVAALKIDVEGYEPRVLGGARATLARTGILLIELSPALSRAGGLDVSRALDDIAEAGFVPDIWDRPGALPDLEGLRTHDAQATIGFRRRDQASQRSSP